MVGRALVFSALMAVFSTVGAKEHSTRKFDGMTLSEFIHYAAMRLEHTVVISPRVRLNRKVKLFIPDKLTDKKLQSVFLTVLKMHGYGAVEVGEIVRIVRSRKMRSMPVPVVTVDTVAVDTVTTDVITADACCQSAGK